MNERQKAARRVMECFVVMQGGDPATIRFVGNAYRWTAPDGREASLGWEE